MWFPQRGYFPRSLSTASIRNGGHFGLRSRWGLRDLSLREFKSLGSKQARHRYSVALLTPKVRQTSLMSPVSSQRLSARSRSSSLGESSTGVFRQTQVKCQLSPNCLMRGVLPWFLKPLPYTLFLSHLYLRPFKFKRTPQ